MLVTFKFSALDLSYFAHSPGEGLRKVGENTMSDNAPDNTPTKIGGPNGSGLCQQLSTTMLDDYTEQLIGVVESSTHGFSVEDIRAFLVQYKADTISADQSVFKEQFQRCLNRREQEIFEANRREPFKRVLTMRFVDLLPPEGGLDDSGTYVSRRMLPGLFLALEKMVGSDPFIQGFEACTTAIDATRDDNGTIIWEDIYSHAASVEAVDDLLMHLVTHFDNPMKRMMWVLNIINNDLADAEDFDFEGDANIDWELNERGLINVMRHLFRNLRHRLKDKSQAQALAAKYGQDAAHQLVALITALDHAEV